MTNKSLGSLFRISFDDGVELENLTVYQIPTKEQFFELLPDYYEPTDELLSDSDTDNTLKVYLAFTKLYCIDDNGNTYLVDNINEAQAIQFKNMGLSESDSDQRDFDKKDLENWLTNQ